MHISDRLGSVMIQKVDLLQPDVLSAGPCLLVQSSTKYDATLNLTTARVLALSMPRRADGRCMRRRVLGDSVGRASLPASRDRAGTLPACR